MSSLINIVSWSQKLACEVLQPGALAVDLTAGKGRDTFTLAKAVGPAGQVVAFDLQAPALEQTTELLQARGIVANRWSVDQKLSKQPGIFLVQACHSNLSNILQRPVQVVMANLGYLPGGEQTLITRPDSTLAALEQSAALLAVGGRLIVTVYPSHPGGAEEARAVETFFRNLAIERWQVLSLRAVNHIQAPFLLAGERLT